MTIDTEKDDLATQQMMSMLDETPSETPDDSIQAGELLDALNHIEDIDNEEESIEIPTPPEDGQDQDIQIEASPSIDTEEIEEMPELKTVEPLELPEDATEEEVRESLPDTLETLPTELEDAIEEEVPVVAEMQEESIDLAPAEETTLEEVIDEIPTTSIETEETPVIANDPSSEETETDTKVETPEKTKMGEILDPSTSIQAMEEAITQDQEIQTIAQSVHATATEAIKVSLATAQKAQERTQATQKAIEATFAATERAFEAAKNAGYELDLAALEAPISSEELTKKLDTIKQKNIELQNINQELKARVANLT